jgi:Flp pilus assembly protein TadG
MGKEWQSLKTHDKKLEKVPRELCAVKDSEKSRNPGLSSYAKSIKSERGSASVEFVLLALPLFIPIFIFLNQFSNLSSQEMALQTLARESVRAFVESDSDQSGGALVNQVIIQGGAKLGLKPDEISEIESEIKCSTTPCHLSNSRVRITLTLESGNGGRVVQASAQQYFSPWSH